MFWFLHYAVKVTAVLALIGLGILLYVNRHWFAPAEAWVETMRRTQTEPLPVLGELQGRVVRVTTGDSFLMREAQGPQYSIRIAGVLAPPASRNLRSAAAQAFRASRDHLAGLLGTNEVRVAYTFLAPEGAGIGGVYLNGTNVALPLLDSGLVIVHDSSLRSLPVQEQVQLLAIEKLAREAQHGFWTNTVDLRAKPAAASP